MSRRRSRLPSATIASSSIRILSAGEFLKGLCRTPRKSRSGPIQTSTPSTSTNAIPSPEENQEDDFLLETLAALEKADEEVTRPITKRKLRETITLGIRFPKKRRKKHHVANKSLVLSRYPQNERFLSSGEPQEDSDPDPILSGITQTDNPVPVLLKPRFPVSVIRGSIVSPWTRRGRNLTAAAGDKESRVIHCEKENWGDRIDNLLVPGKVRDRAIRERTPSLNGALELANVADRTQSPTRTNKFPHFVSFDSQLATPGCSPSQDRGLVGMELGPELGFFQAPETNLESRKPAIADQSVPRQSGKICTIDSAKLSGRANKLTGEDHIAESPLGLRISEFGSDSRDHAEPRGSAAGAGDISSQASPSLIGSGITVENGGQESMMKTLGYPWERFDRSPTPFPSPEPGIAPRGSDCSSLLRFWESQLSVPSPDTGLSGGDIEVCVSPMQEPEDSPQFWAEGETKKPSHILEEEMGEGNSTSSSVQLWKDYQLGRLELISPPKQPQAVILESPKSMPRSDQPAQVQMEQVMPPPPLRQPRKLIDEGKSQDDMGYINGISGRDYFSSAQKILSNYEPARPTVSPSQSNWKTNTNSAKVQLGTKKFHKAQPPTYSLSPLSTPTPARTYSNMPLKDIIKRREAVPLRRPTISSSFKSPFLANPPMINMNQTIIPATSGVSRQGQGDRIMPIVSPGLFTIPASIVAEPENRAKRRMTQSQAFSLPTSTRAPQIGPRRATQGVLLQAHRGMTIRFEPSQKPFKPPLMEKPLEPTHRTSRQPSGFGATDEPVSVYPRRKVITKAWAKSAQGKAGVGAHCAGASKAATSSFAEVQAAW
ncbi:hypothetical protein HOY82DRAFT_652588 [Tuber indicum]|nr:hypothetical protein HOY82DRAFT_652588 [Tuber indicum]